MALVGGLVHLVRHTWGTRLELRKLLRLLAIHSLVHSLTIPS